MKGITGPWGERNVDYVLKTSTPGVTDSDYDVSTIWIDTSTEKVYILTDNTSGAAVWLEVLASGGVYDHGELTGLSDDDHSLYSLVAGTRPIKYETLLEKTADYTLTSADFGKIVAFNSAIASGTMSFPSVGASEDGAVVTFFKTGSSRLIIESADTDGIDDSSTPGTIYTDSTLASITLVYIHSITTWVIKSAKGEWVTT